MGQVNLTRQKEFIKQKELTKQMRLSDMEKTNMTKQKNLSKQKGFTLIELAFVLIVMAIIAAFTTKAYLFQKAFEREEARADKTIQEIIQISEAMGGWRLDRGDWAGWIGAGAVNNCVDAITELTNATPTAYLRYIDVESPYGTNYVTSCDDNNFYIEVKSTEDYAQYIRTHLANTIRFPSHTSATDDTTKTSIPRKTINPTLADFLPLAGGVMQGDINMDGNAITNASDIELNGQNIKLGIGKFISMGSDAFNSLGATVNKPNCRQGARTGTPKIILRLHGITTVSDPAKPLTGVSWSARFNDLGTTKWRLSTTGLKAITGVAETFCDYGTWNR